MTIKSRNAEKPRLDINKLIKLLNLTLSTNDNEALTAMRKANNIVRNVDGYWGGVLGQTDTPNDRRESHYRGRKERIFWPFGKEVFDYLYNRDVWNHFIQGVYSQYVRYEKYLTQAQIDAVMYIFTKERGVR